MSSLMLTRMAWRNLWRNRRRTLVTLSGIVFGTMLAVIFTGMGDYMWTNMIDLAARMGAGHVTLQHPEYLQTPSLKRTVTGVGSLRALAARQPDVTRVVTRVSGNVMLAAGGNSSGAFFLAIDPAEENKETLSVMEALARGRLFTSADERGIVLGWRLAENLGVTLGRKVVYTLTDKGGEIVSGLARVRGIVKTGAAGMDAGLCLLPLGTVRRALGYGPDEATQVAVFVSDQRRSDQVAAGLGAKLGPKVVAVPWHRSQPELAGFITTKVVGTLVIEIFIGLLVAAGIFNTLFVSVMERTREFGIMIAIGYSPGKIFRLVMVESAWVALCGLVLAAAVTALPYYYLSTTGIDISAMMGNTTGEIAGVALRPEIRLAIFPESVALIALAVLLATLLSGLLPAWRAGRVVPVESIRLV